MSDLTLCAKASTAKQPKSERFTGTLPAHSHHRLSVFSGIPTWPHSSSFQGPKVSSVNDGVMTPDRAAAIWENRATEIETAGEALWLKHGTKTLALIRYDDCAPWPKAADGGGHSLVAPTTANEAWTSALPSPGRMDAEHNSPGDFAITRIERSADEIIRIEWTSKSDASDRVEFSEDLSSPWQTRPAVSDAGCFPRGNDSLTGLLPHRSPVRPEAVAVSGPGHPIDQLSSRCPLKWSWPPPASLS